MRRDPPIARLAAAQTVTWAGMYYLFPALLPRWEADLGWSKTELTAAFTTAVALSALCAPLAGRLIDRGHGPAVLGGGALGGGVLVGTLALVAAPWQFFLVWALIGVATAGALYEPCFALITRARGAEARRAITRVTLVAGFAGTLAFPGAHALAEAFGWRAAAGGFAAMILLLAAPLAFGAARRLEAERRAHEADAGPAPHPAAGPAAATPAARPGPYRFLRRPVFWLLAFGFATIALNHGVAVNHLLPILAWRGIGAETAVAAAAAIGPMQVVGRLAMLAAERHVTSATVTVLCFASVATATLAMIGAAALPVLVVAFVVLQGAGNGVTSIMKPVVTRDLLGDVDFATISGALAVPFLGAFAASALAGSLLWTLGGYDLVLWTILGLTLAGLAAFLAARRLG